MWKLPQLINEEMSYFDPVRTVVFLADVIGNFLSIGGEKREGKRPSKRRRKIPPSHLNKWWIFSVERGGIFQSLRVRPAGSWRQFVTEAASGIRRAAFVWVCVCTSCLLFFSKNKKTVRCCDYGGSMGYYRASRGAEKENKRGENITHSLVCPVGKERREGGGSNGSSKNTLHTKIARCCLRDTDLFDFFFPPPIPFFLFGFFLFRAIGTIQHTIYIHVMCIFFLPPTLECRGARWRSVGQSIWRILFSIDLRVFERGRKKWREKKRDAPTVSWIMERNREMEKGGTWWPALVVWRKPGPKCVWPSDEDACYLPSRSLRCYLTKFLFFSLHWLVRTDV